MQKSESLANERSLGPTFLHDQKKLQASPLPKETVEAAAEAVEVAAAQGAADSAQVAAAAAGQEAP
jgi:hypothetical protein